MLQPNDVLVVPHRKRLSHTYTTSDSGARELSLFYGVHEVTFDEARLFPFGEQLVKQSSFAAGTATSWGDGYDWTEIRALLDSLVELGILKRAGDGEDDPRGPGPVPSLLPAAECKIPRMWSTATCETITRDLAGRAVEIGYIEAFVFTFRLAHCAIDGDGRQVGEANVYPSRLRVDQDTEWRVCQYSGSRYRDDAPMNVTALKAMIKYWKPMMVTLLAVRAEVKRRLADSRDTWTVGDLHTFANVVLTLPAFVLLNGGGSPSQPPLHPVLSSLFRITDGIRMTTHEMLFMSAEPGRRPDEHIGAGDLIDFAEQHGLLMTDTGVCSGPRALIDEFLATVCDGTPVEGTEGLVLPTEVSDLLAELPAAVDYGLHALQVWTVTRSVWMAMSRAYAAVREVVEHGASEACLRLRERLDRDRAILDRALVGSEYECEVQHRAHVDAYAQAWRGLRSPIGPATLDARIAVGRQTEDHVRAAARLRELLAPRLFGPAPAEAAIEQLVAIVVRYLRQEQAILAAATELEGAINRMLDRPPPKRPLTVRDCRIAYTLRDDHLAGFPYLFDALEDVTGIAVEATRDGIEICDRRAAEIA